MSVVKNKNGLNGLQVNEGLFLELIFFSNILFRGGYLSDMFSDRCH